MLFGFTNCADVCPLAMERLGQLRDSGGLNAADVAYVMISVDGERDTPAVMKEFLARYPEEFIGFTARAESRDTRSPSSSRRRSSRVRIRRTASTTWRTRRRSSCSTPPAIFAPSSSARRSSRWRPSRSRCSPNAEASAVVQEILVARVQIAIELGIRCRGARLAAAHVREHRVLEEPLERRALLGR